MQTPDNAAYYHAAYIAVAVIYGLYALSLSWRRRRARAQALAQREAARV